MASSSRSAALTALGGAAMVMFAISACSAAPPPTGPTSPGHTPGASAAPVPAAASTEPAPKPAVHTGFVGYRWTVISVSYRGQEVAVPAGFAEYLMFFADGQFVGNEPINTHSGPYRVTDDGFTTGQIASTLAAGGGDDLTFQLSIGAIQAFSVYPGTRAAVDVTGTRMIVRENGFTLVCVRAAKAGFPTPLPSWIAPG